MKVLNLILFILWTNFALAKTSDITPRGGILLIADFDSGKKPNNLGGDFGRWVINPKDKTQTCVESLTKEIRHGVSGYSLKVVYDVDSPHEAYNGIWLKLNSADFSSYTKLIFWVKGDIYRGYTKVFKVELKNKMGDVGSYYVSTVCDDWTKVEIPLKGFNLKDYSNMEELVFVFEDKKVTEKEGILYIDDIYLER